ncbi:DgyrCDS8765 [Dimorphilus gyrociliatus]|uniref:DgyrCDS8765 n=1 Tax=Dimorphilus gyrociliatus TaxID=2664684 RepID=A0A7I8VV22_9ANNE|nr:DgyrCDS8765 [Dimorphilus gyrociliatus]
MERTTNNVPAYIKPTLSSLRRSVRVAPSSSSLLHSLLEDRTSSFSRDFKRSASFNSHRRYEPGIRTDISFVNKPRNQDTFDRHAHLKVYGRRNTTNPAHRIEMTEDDLNDGVILPSVVYHIRNILEQYPCHGQILYELLQYAEDTGARIFKLLVDSSQDAVYIYHDVSLSTTDWKAFRNLCEHPTKHKDNPKSGHFGLGFKSLFHLTDIVHVLSDRKLAIIEPLNNASTTKAFKLNEKPELFNLFNGYFGCNESTLKHGRFHGTIIRFVLRQNASKISSTIYTSQSLQYVIDEFQGHLHTSFLFMNNIEVVELLETRRDEICSSSSAHLAPECLQKIREFRNDIRNTQEISRSALIIVNVLKSGKERTYKWIIGAYKTVRNLSAICKNILKELPLYPYASVALPITLDDSTVWTQADGMEGGTFALLPLEPHPNFINLPVHVNARFALELTKRVMLWPRSYYGSADVQMDKRLIWNKCIVSELVPVAYAATVLASIEFCKKGLITTEQVYRAFPRLESSSTASLSAVYGNIFKHPVIYTHSKEWVTVENGVYDTTSKLPLNVRNILVRCGLNLANIPDHVMEAVRHCNISIRKVNGPLLATVIRNQTAMSEICKLDLLDYFCTSDVDFLYGLPLLPLQNGTFVKFESSERKIYVAKRSEDVEILPKASYERIMRVDLVKHVKQSLINASSRHFAQLRILDISVIAELLKTYIINIPELNKETERWLAKLWFYIHRFTPFDLSRFEGLPIIPIDRKIVRLSSSSGMIVKQLHHLHLNEDIQTILVRMGANVITNLPSYLSGNSHLCNFYIKPPTSHGVCSTLAHLCKSNESEFFEKFFTSTTANEKKSLRQLFMKLDYSIGKSSLREFLRNLPIFETLDGHFICVNETNIAVQSINLPVPLCKPVINLSALPCADSLATLLGVRLLSHQDFFVEIVFTAIESAYYKIGEVTEVMIHILKNYCCTMTETFQSALAGLPFIPKGETLMTADRFYDPDSIVLQQVFKGEDNFPTGPFRQPEVLQVLRKVGLRTDEYVEPEDLECCALVCDNDVEKSLALIEYVCRNSFLLHQLCHDAPLSAKLAGIHWIPVLKERPPQYPASLDWHCEEQIVRPIDIFEFKYSYVVGSLKSACCQELPGNISELWFQTPSAEDIVQHLKNVVRCYSATEKGKYLYVTTQIYSELFKNPIQKVSNLLEGEKWVWNGQGYCAVEDIVFKRPFIDLQPFIYLLPLEMMQFRRYLSDLGVKDDCYLPDVLYKIYRKHEAGANVEMSRDLHLAISILNEIKSRYDDIHLEKLKSSIYVPIKSENQRQLKMDLAENCHYSTNGENIPGKNIVHQSVPVNTCIAFKIENAIAKPIQQDDIYTTTTGGGTRILKEIISELTPTSVVRYFLSLAEECKANELNILYDTRENWKQKTLITEKMSLSQGKSIWFHFNSTLSRDHIEKITAENHLSDSLGFSCVYSITETPSIATDDQLIILDPQGTYLPRKKAVQLDVKKHLSLIEKLSDQFELYKNVFGYNFQVYNGTLIRLPLRIAEQAEISEISNQPLSDENVRSLINEIDDIFLIFCNYVKTINIKILKNSPNSCEHLKLIRKIHKANLPHWPKAVSVFQIDTHHSGKSSTTTDWLTMNITDGCNAPSVAVTTIEQRDGYEFSKEGALINSSYNRAPYDGLPIYIYYSKIETFQDEIEIDELCNLYLELLLFLANSNRPTPYYSLWPTSTEPIMMSMVEEFLQRVTSEDRSAPKIWSDGKNWANVSGSYFIPEGTQPYCVVAAMKQILVGKTVIEIPEALCTRLEKANVFSTIKKRLYDFRRFFREIFLPNSHKLREEIRNDVLIRALSQKDEDLNEALGTFPCIPTSPNGQKFARLTNLIDRLSDLGELYSVEEGKFVYEPLAQFCSKFVLRREINWTDIAERLKTIPNLKKEIAKEKTRLALNVLAKKIETEREEAEKFRKTLESLKFLWDFHKKFYVAPNKVYSSIYSPLVSYVAPVFDVELVDEQHRTAVEEFLFTLRPSVTNVLEQLECVIKTASAFDETQKIIYAIYDFLQEQPNFEDIVKKIRSKPCIFSQGRFLFSNQVALNFNQVCPPCLYGLSEGFKRRYEKLLKALDVPEMFGIGDYVQALAELKSMYDASALDQNQLKVALRVVALLNEAMSENGLVLNDVTSKYGSVYIPNSDCVLRDSNEQNNVWHPHIPFALLRQLKLNKDTPVKVCTSAERPTWMIQRSLSVYPKHSCIFKELVRNADLTGCTSIDLVHDRRQHGCRKIFSDKWKSLQGAALLIITDKPFDYKDISLAYNSVNPSTSIFGNFNWVYYLTDVPLLLTQTEKKKQLYVFDPHMSFISEVANNKPCKKFEDIDELQKQYPDIFSVFPKEDIFPKSNYTILRLPLRNEQVAATSEISGDIINSDLLDELLNAFKSEANDSFVFLSNLRQLRIWTISSEGKNLVKTHETKTMIKEYDDNSHVLQLKDSTGLKEKWAIFKSPVIPSSEVYKNSSKISDNKDLHPTVSGSIAAKLNSNEHRDRPRKSYSHLPLAPNVPLPVHVNAEWMLEHDSRRNLWPIEEDGVKCEWNMYILEHILAPLYVSMMNKIPVHLFPSLQQCHGEENCGLITFGELVQISNYYSLFPSCPREKDSYWYHLVTFIYERMKNDQTPLFPVVTEDDQDHFKIKWLSFDSQPIFGTTCKKDDSLKRILLNCGMKLLSLPNTVCDTINELKLNVKVLSPKIVRKYLREEISPRLPEKIANTVIVNIKSLEILLKYCLKDTEDAKNDLEGSPFILTCDKTLDVFQEKRIIFLNKNYQYLPSLPNLFLHSAIEDTFQQHINLNSHHLINNFDTEQLANYLSKTLDQEIYLDSSGLVEWPKNVKKSWLRDVWKFLYENDLGPVERWALIPALVKDGEKFREYLVPINLGHIVADFRHVSVVNVSIRDSLRALELAELDYKLLPSNVCDYLGSMTSNLDKPIDMLKCIHYRLGRFDLSVTLKHDDAMNVLNYFRLIIDEWINEPEAVSMMKKLPLYFTSDSSFVSLEIGSFYILPKATPYEGIKIWKQDATFLLYSQKLMKLYESLGCKPLSIRELYEEFIFSKFESLNDKERSVHLKYLLEINDEKLEKSLKSIAIMKDTKERLQKANYFFDPRNILFAMFRPNHLPPYPFDDIQWSRLLKNAGLQSEMTVKLGQSFISEVEHELSLLPQENSKSKVRQLLLEIYKDVSYMENTEILEALKLSKILPVCELRDKLVALSKPFKMGGYVSLEKSVIKKHELLCWTTAAIVPNWAYPNDNQTEVFEIMNFKRRPEVERVVQHMKRVCNENNFYETKKECMLAFYSYLKECSGSRISEEESQMLLSLSESKCIVIGNQFIEPIKVTLFKFGDRMEPYLYQLPNELREYKEGLFLIGMKHSLGIDHFANILNSLYQTTGGDNMDPNELQISLKSVKGLFSLISCTSLVRDVLYLPSSQGKLYKSNQLVFIDEMRLNERILYLDKETLMDLNECGLECGNHEDLISYLPKHLRPVNLTEIVQEELTTSLIATQSKIAKVMKERLFSNEFAYGIIRIINHRQHFANHEFIKNKLKMLNVQSVEKIVTHLVHRGEKLPQSETELNCFYKENVLFISQTASISEEMLVNIAETLCKFIKNKTLRSLIHLLPPILTCSPSQISAILDKLQVRPYKSTSLPSVGLPVSKQDQLRLGQTMNKYNEGEWVGVVIDGAAVYGVILERQDVEDDDGLMLSFYIVDIGNRKVDLSQSDIYQFDRVKSNRPTSMPPPTTERKPYPESIPKEPRERSEPRVKRQPSPTPVFTSTTESPPHPMPVKTEIPETKKPTPKFSSGSKDDSDPFGTAKTRRAGATRRKMERRWQTTEGVSPGQSPPRGSNYWKDFINNLNTEQEASPNLGRKFSPEKTSSWHESAPQQPPESSYMRRESSPPKTTEEAKEKKPRPHSYHYNESREKKERPSRFSQFSNKPRTNIEETFSKKRENEPAMDETDIPKVRVTCSATDKQDERTEDTPEEKSEESSDSSEPSSEEKEKSEEEAELEQLLNSISDQMEDSWKLENGKKKRAIKQLLLKWHPDKNVDNEQIATVVTQHIHAEVERLEAGLPRPQTFHPNFHEEYNLNPRNPFAKSTDFQKNFYSAYQHFYEEMKKKSEKKRENRKREQEQEKEKEQNTHIEIAKDFLKLAKSDIESVKNDTNVTQPSFAWACLKAHQAGEKALKAAQYSQDSVCSFNHDLTTLAATFRSNIELQRISNKLQTLVGNASILYNPDPALSGQTSFTKQKADEATQLASQIIYIIEKNFF